MSRCLLPDEVIDAVDGTLPGDRRAHLTTCAACRQSVDDVHEALGLADVGAVPEPPAAFWPAINVRVQAAISEADEARGWRAWLRWDVVVPLAGLTLLVMALASAVDDAATRARGDSGDQQAALPAGEPLPDALALVEDLAALLPEGGWDALGVTRLPDLGVAAAALSADEQAALAALLQSAVERPTS